MTDEIHDEPFSYQEFLDFFGALLDSYNRPRNPTLIDIYWQNLQSIKPMSVECVDVICGIINNPPDKFPSPLDLKNAIRQHRIDRAPALSASHKRDSDGWKPMTIDQARRFRLGMLAHIYSKQGESKFYRAMLNSGGGIFGQIGANVLAVSGLTLTDVAVTHQDVLLHLGIDPGEAASSEPATVVTAEIDVEKRDRLLEEVLGG